MMDLTIAQALIVIWLATLVTLVLSLVALCVIVLIIVKHLAPKVQAALPVPSFDRVTGPPDALNGFPEPDETAEESEPNVARNPKVTQVLGMADQQSQADREQWWEEKRSEGLSEGDIAELELSSVVDLGDR